MHTTYKRPIVARINSDDYTLADFLESEDSDLFQKATSFTAFLDDWTNKGTYSYHRLATSANTNRTMIRDRETCEEQQMVVMASNNYLGLNTHPEVVKAACDAIAKYGTGTCGSRFLSGTYDLVEELERKLAAFEGKESAVVFTSGYQANVGTISALLRHKDLAFIDRLCHASIIDGCRLSGCKMHTFRHNDMDDLKKLLERCDGKEGGKLIIVDGIFSMDGDMAPLADIVKLAGKHGARVMVDEAHATGVVGPTGRGTVEYFGVKGEVDIVLGTFSKTFAATGGFIATSREVANYVRHYGRSYMFSASPTPAAVATVLKGLEIIDKEPQLRERLWENIRYFHGELKRLGFNVFPDPPASAVLTIEIGPDIKVREMSKAVYSKGIFMSTVAYPAVPRDKGKLRISLSAKHTREDLDKALTFLAEVGLASGMLS
jgi:glycine C-acetyltransferase